MAKSAWTKKGQFSTRERQPRLDEMVEMLKLKSGEFHSVRFVGPVHVFKEHWIKRRTKSGKVASIRKLCIAQFDEKGEQTQQCPYCEHLGDKPRMVALQNVIDRAAQADEPRRKQPPSKSESKPTKLWDGESKGFIKNKGSKTWTPVKVLRLPTSAANKVQELVELNTHTSKKTGELMTYGPEHPVFGLDLNVKYDESKAAPGDRYSVVKDRRTKLTDDEKSYLIWNLGIEKPETFEAATKEAHYMGKYLVVEQRDDKGKAIEVDAPVQPPKGSPAAKKGKAPDDDLDFDDLDQSDLSVERSASTDNSYDIDDDDEGDDDEPKKSKKSKLKSKSKDKSNGKSKLLKDKKSKTLLKKGGDKKSKLKLKNKKKSRHDDAELSY